MRGYFNIFITYYLSASDIELVHKWCDGIYCFRVTIFYIMYIYIILTPIIVKIVWVIYYYCPT